MDALVRNKCESEFLAIAYEIIRTLELGITLAQSQLLPAREIVEALAENIRQMKAAEDARQYRQVSPGRTIYQPRRRRRF